MINDILGEWDLTLGENGRGDWDGRLAFTQADGRLRVQDADPESRSTPSRVEVAGATLRFEMLSAGSSRGNAHHSYELTLAEDGTLRGTRRRGLLARVPLVGTRVAAAAATSGLPEPGTPVALETVSDSLTEARARAAAAAERANLAAAQAAAAAAEADAAEALELARQAAARVAAARAAVQQFGHAAEAPRETRTEVPSEVLAILPAPSQPPVFAPSPQPADASVLDDTAAAEAGGALEAPAQEELRDSMAG